MDDAELARIVKREIEAAMAAHVSSHHISQDRREYMRLYQQKRRKKLKKKARKQFTPNVNSLQNPKKTPRETCMANFELARRVYPGKKRGLEVEFENFCKKHKDWPELLDDDGLAQCIQVLIQRKAYSDGFWPMFQTFCNQSRYEEALQ